jgi:hypothetical protein
VRESAIEAKLAQGAKRLGWRALKLVSPGTDGVPDRLMLGPGGRVIFVELKAEGGKLTQLQRYQIDRLRRLGQDVRVLVGAAEVEEFLREIAGKGEDG